MCPPSKVSSPAMIASIVQQEVCKQLASEVSEKKKEVKTLPKSNPKNGCLRRVGNQFRRKGRILYRGHTHSLVDQSFSSVARQLNTNRTVTHNQFDHVLSRVVHDKDNDVNIDVYVVS